MTDQLTRRFNELASRAEGPLRGAALDGAGHPDLADLGNLYLARPLFLPEHEIRRFEADLLAVVDLLTQLPWRVFDGDVDQVCRMLDLDPRKAALVREFEPRPTVPFGRIDAYHDGESLRILEFNATSSIGGQQWVGPAAAAWLGAEAFRTFAAEHRLRHVDTTAVLARELRTAARSVTGGDPVVALVEGPGGLAGYGDAWRPLQRLLRSHGLDCRLGETGDLEVRDGRVLLRGARVDIVYRLFDLDQVLDDPQALAVTEQLRDAHRDGRVLLWSPLETDLHSNKRWMAYLSDPSLGAGLSTEEQALVDRLLPWTRALTPDTVRTAPELLDTCRERRERLIIKPDEGFANQGIVCGWQVDDAQWASALDTAVAGGAVVQERVVPRQDWVVHPDTGVAEPWDACYGLYWMPGGYGGGGARLVPSGQPFTLDAGSRRLSGIFHYPEDGVLHGEESR